MKPMRYGRVVANFLGFQLCWIACAVGAAQGYPIVGPAVVIVWLALHLERIEPGPHDAAASARNRWIELRLLLASALFGYALDSLLAIGGVLGFPAHAGPAWPTTPWMVALWAAFAGTLRHSLDWTRRRYALGALAGAVFGPLAYRAGDALGAITLADPPFGLLAVAAAWAVAMPLLLWIRERIDIRE